MNEKKKLRGRVILSPELEEKRTQHVRQMEREDCPALPQREPLAVEVVYNQFYADFDGAWDIYFAKRMEMFGVVTKIGPDLHGLPSIELSSCAGGRCYALFIARTEEELYEGISLGDTVVCRGNLINAREPFGAVMKKSEIVRITSKISV